jgi:hypothetical protein
MTSYIEAVEKMIDQNNKLPIRLKELEERNKELTLQLLATSGQAADALDKLTKAVAGLRKIADHKHFSLDQGWIQNTEARIASATLVELGETE